MSSFQMESLKVMEKFDGGNFHLWKFKMRMMLSKHGLWKCQKYYSFLIPMLMNVSNIHQENEQYSHPCSNQVKVQKWKLLKAWRRLGLGFGGSKGQVMARVRVWWQLGLGDGQGQGLVVARVKRRLGLGFDGGQVRVKWRLL